MLLMIKGIFSKRCNFETVTNNTIDHYGNTNIKNERARFDYR